jgi:hypothetical protein
MPIINLTAVKDALLGKSKAIEVQGTKLPGGEEWTKKFFKNNTELCEALEAFEVGDDVNVVMEQDPANKKFWNIVDFREVTEEDREKLDDKKKFGTKGGGGGAPVSGSVRRVDGGSRGDDTNRSAAIYLAREVVNMVGVGEMTTSEVARELITIADTFIYPYIKDGVVPPAPVSTVDTVRPRRTKAPDLPTA